MPRGRLNLATWRKSLTERTVPREYLGEDLRCVAMPLGGIGTGSIALCGDGSLRQWQVVNQVNHQGYVPNSFFAVWTRLPGAQPVARVLQSARFFQDDGFIPAESVSDHIVPSGLFRWTEGLPLIADTRFRGEYPLAHIVYEDEDLPVEVSMEAASPFVAFDADASGVPGILFEFTVRNRTKQKVSAALAASLQNFVGWDGVGLISDVQNPGFGGNQNRLHRFPGRMTLEMTNSMLPLDHPFWGELGLACFGENVTALQQWNDIEYMWREFERQGQFTDVSDAAPSGRWQTWNGSIAARLDLQPGETKKVTFAIGWYFPNRYVNWKQPVPVEGEDRSRFWLGNRYNRFGGVMPVLRHLHDDAETIWGQARKFRDTLYQASQPYWFLDAAAANIVPARTNICLQTEKGEFYGFEGGFGASTDWCDVGGCCALNCTHVWNYVMTVARLWPELERSMRRTDWLVNQHASGYLPHRTPLPEYLPRLWGVEIGGPNNPALDGLFGGVLKTYREYLACGKKSFLAEMGPHCFLALDYTMSACDTDGDGVIKGEQPNTYDIHLYGPNTFIGTLYIAALLAGAEMADRMEHAERAGVYRERATKSSQGYDQVCWDGEYYRQIVDLAEHPKYQFGDGCASDQLLGQWWAHVLGLGYVLPKERVRAALHSIFKYNFRDGFEDFKQEPRVFASIHDRGLLNASYPKGGRPEVPLLYSDEVWTGVEYQVASLMLYEGLTEEGLAIAKGVRDRYDGFERSPWNEVECGDHYVRSMSSWALLDLSSGLVYDQAAGRLRIGPTWQAGNFTGFFAAGTAYGLIHRDGSGVKIEVAEGEFEVETVAILASGTGSVKWAGETFNSTSSQVGEFVEVKLAMRIRLTPGSPLEITLG